MSNYLPYFTKNVKSIDISKYKIDVVPTDYSTIFSLLDMEYDYVTIINNGYKYIGIVDGKENIQNENIDLSQSQISDMYCFSGKINFPEQYPTYTEKEINDTLTISGYWTTDKKFAELAYTLRNCGSNSAYFRYLFGCDRLYKFDSFVLPDNMTFASSIVMHEYRKTCRRSSMFYMSELNKEDIQNKEIMVLFDFDMDLQKVIDCIQLHNPKHIFVRSIPPIFENW